MVELDNIHSTEEGGDMPPPDAPGPTLSTYAPDEETRAAAKVLKTLQKQQPTASLPKGSGLSTPPGEADYFKGGSLMRTVQQRQRMHSTPVSQLSTPTTPAGLISTITVGILPPARVLAEDLTRATLRERSPNLYQMTLRGVGKQATSESTDSCSMGERGGTKENQASSSKPGVLTTHSSAPGSSGSAAGGSSCSSQDPNELRQGVSHLALVIYDDEFTDNPNQIIPTEDAFALPFLPRQGMEGFDRGYLLPVEVTAF